MNGIGWVVVALGLLIFPGALYNNANNSGLVVAGGTIGNCDNNLDICNYTNAVGCQSNSAFCTLSGQTISFFNAQSPFTQLLSGNLFALFTNLNPMSSTGAAQTSWSGTHGPFDITGNPNYYSANCFGANSTASLSLTNGVGFLGHCTQAKTDNSNITKTSVATWNNWNSGWNTTLALMFYNLGNGTFPFGCSWLSQINYTALGNGAPGYTYYGCSVSQGSNQSPVSNNPTHRLWGLLFAYPNSNGAFPACKTHAPCSGLHTFWFVQLTNWYVQGCLQNSNMKAFASTQCNNYLQGFKGIAIPGTNITFVPNSGGAIVFGFLAGIILLLGGLGLQLGMGGGVSAGVNRQGTKLFQVLGIGLLVWTFAYSQFSPWFTSGNLPYGLDGALGIVSLALSGVFFFGVYNWATAS